MRIISTFVFLLIWNSLPAQTSLKFDIFSPDTVNYDVQIKNDSPSIAYIYVDFGTFNYKDEPEISFFIKPYSHPFILDYSFWNIAYLKPIFDRHITIQPGNTGKVISFKYLSKYNKYFKGVFDETSVAHTTHGRLQFEIKGGFLPRDILFSKCATYHPAALIGTEIMDTLHITNKGSHALTIEKASSDDGMQLVNDSGKKIPILPGKSQSLIFSYKPAAKGNFSKNAGITFSRINGQNYTAHFKIRGVAK